jgi:hypothetical protein
MFQELLEHNVSSHHSEAYTVSQYADYVQMCFGTEERLHLMFVDLRVVLYGRPEYSF